MAEQPKTTPQPTQPQPEQPGVAATPLHAPEPKAAPIEEPKKV